MYPDVQDVRNATPKLADSPMPEDIWEQTVFAHSVLFEAKHACYGHGRHAEIPVKELLKFIENVTGREISPWAFVTALRLLGWKSNPRQLNPNDLTKAKLKLPPLDRFPIDLWRERRGSSLKKEVEEEKARFAHSE